MIKASALRAAAPRHAGLDPASIVPRALGFVATALAAALLTAAAPIGPTPKQFTALRTAKGEACPPTRNLVCTPLGDPTELKCTWQERFKDKAWTTSTALVAKDGAKWTWLDGGPRCSSLPQS